MTDDADRAARIEPLAVNAPDAGLRSDEPQALLAYLINGQLERERAGR